MIQKSELYSFRHIYLSHAEKNFEVALPYQFTAGAPIGKEAGG